MDNVFSSASQASGEFMCLQLPQRLSSVVVFALCSFCVVATAQLPKPIPKTLGLDVIKTQKHLLFGFVLAQRADGSIDCAVDRAWLQSTQADLAAELLEKEKKPRVEAKQTAIDRIKSWLMECNGDERIRLKIFLEDELRHAEAVEAESPNSTFMLITLPAKEIVKITPAKPEQRHIAAVAYKHDLPDVATTPTVVLEKKLKESGVDTKTERFDLTGKLPSLVLEGDRQWAARQALVEHDLVVAVELQGKGSMLMGADDSIDPMAIFKELAGAQNDMLSELFKELKLDMGNGIERAEKDAWKQSAINKAEKKKARGVLVYRLNQQMGSATTKVTTNFLAKGSDGQWFDVYSSQHSDDGSKATKEELDRMKNDPTLQRILPMLEAVGGNAQVDQALRQGAATAAALGEARSAFSEFKNPITRDLLSPPINLPK